ncbi:MULTISPECIES: group II intron reverse transcriptase/maturase [Niallia]|uniref:group II intron reverse transcriptase/maturase n=1 Tax=Niallia TaxID=2837506 RepID=UPI0014905C73|nr:group II intron reverse transcriptase/maturase [Niallia circulans]MED5102889.1 group II intron reverse transcriptase/maturase [Niallia circulans]QJX65102.1 group II intron reverse transcriptase/maturase [Niallia circulans]
MKDNKQFPQNEKELKLALDSMYRLAKESNKPFYNLIELMKNEQTILTAIHNIKGNKGSKTAGIDGKTIDYYLQMDRDKLMSLIRRNINNYQPSPVRRKYIPKSDGKQRPLGIPNMIDRIIQEIAKIVIEPIAEAKFYHYSFGFRPMRSAEQAIAETLERIRRSKTYWVIEGDIKGYFDNINHNKLIEIMWTLGIRDKRVLMMIKKMLKAGIMEEGNFRDSVSGSPQGGIISPLLANIYLNYFDWEIARMFQEHPARYKVKDVSRNGLQRVRQRHEDTFLIRYADDWVILCKSEENAKRILKKVEKYFNHQLKLELSKEKTLITDVRTNRVNFLGFWIFAEEHRLRKGSIQGKAIPNMDKAKLKIKEINKDIKTLYDHRGTKSKQVAIIESINSKIVGIANYYKIANVSTIFQGFDKRIHYAQWRTWLFMNNRRGRYHQLTTPADTLINRRDRHKEQKSKVFFVEEHGAKVGITKFAFTPKRNAMKVNLLMSPYTEEGRNIYKRTTGKREALERPNFFQEDIPFYQLNNRYPIYNFEFYLNREYAFNRDRGKCNCCKVSLYEWNLNTHHKNPKLPLNKVNKVINLVSLCKTCHKLVHNENPVTHTKGGKKIEQLRKLLKEAK